MDSDLLSTHSVRLSSERLVLRPMTEGDWDILLAWSSDPSVLYFSEGDDVQSRSLEEVQDIYRWVSQKAFCFIAELDAKPIGECWLQQMNVPHILAAYPDLDTRRIDLMIGVKEHWGKGFGTEILRVLLKFAFAEQNADMVFGCGIADYNARSLGAFRKAGFSELQSNVEPPGRKAKISYNLGITKAAYLCSDNPSVGVGGH